MFDSLDDKIRHDHEVEIPRQERYIRNALIALLSILLFGGLYYAIRMID